MLTTQCIKLLRILQSLVVSGLHFKFVVCHISHFCLLQSSRTRVEIKALHCLLVGVWHREYLGEAECGQVHRQHELSLCKES